MTGWEAAGTGVTAGGDHVVATVSSEHGTALVTAAKDVTFGRDSSNEMRIGAAPIYDDIVPRRAGRVFYAGGRVMVENTDDRLAFDLRVGGRARLVLPPGDWHALRDEEFDVLVAGGSRTYELAVRVKTQGRPVTAARRDSDPPLDPPTGAIPQLTDRQRHILDAYVAPLQEGALVATHQQVADRLRISRALVRVECERIWSALFLAGVPMRSLGDARDEIVDAWARHRF